MKGNPEERAVALGQYITETGATVRRAARVFGISKSTVHMVIVKQNGFGGLFNKTDYKKAHICHDSRQICVFFLL